MWRAGILNLFGGVLIQKRRAEVALEESGLPYVIVRPGGMERPKVVPTAALYHRVYAALYMSSPSRIPKASHLALYGYCLIEHSTLVVSACGARTAGSVRFTEHRLHVRQDDYKETHNVRLAPRDSEFGGQVSRWQVAEVIAAAVANPSLAENKVGAAALLGLYLLIFLNSACSSTLQLHVQ